MSIKRNGVPEYDKADLDEPLFVLRAQDSIAPEAVLQWALTASMRGVSKKKIAEARQCARDMATWQNIHGSKVPD